MKLFEKRMKQKSLARELAGIDERDKEQLTSEIADYFGKVFDMKV